MLASETEKDDVNEDRGGIVRVDPTIPWSRGRLDRRFLCGIFTIRRTACGGTGEAAGGGDDSRASQLLAIRIAKLRILKGRTRVEVLEVDGGSFESSGAAAERVE